MTKQTVVLPNSAFTEIFQEILIKNSIGGIAPHPKYDIL
jgi:hypothetical protein